MNKSVGGRAELVFLLKKKNPFLAFMTVIRIVVLEQADLISAKTHRQLGLQHLFEFCEVFG